MSAIAQQDPRLPVTVLHRSPPLSDETGTGHPRARLVMVLNEAC